MEPDTQDTQAVPMGLSSPDTGVPIGTATPPVALPDEVAQSRAEKFRQGLKQYIPPMDADQIKDQIQKGQEQQLRQLAASNQNVEKSNQKLQLLRDLASQSDKPLDETDVSRIMDPFNPINAVSDPDSVLEKGFATKYISNIQDAVDATKSNVSDAQEDIPQTYNDIVAKGGELTAKMEFARTLLENMDAKVGQQSWGGYLADSFKNMWQPYVEAKLRGNTPDVGYLAGGGLGSNLQLQADHIFSLPFEQFSARAKEITDRLSNDNPQLAQKFAEYLYGLPSTDRILDNVFTGMAPLDAAAIAEGGVKALRAVDLARRTNTAVRQLVRAAGDVGTNTAAQAEAAGNLSEAAAQRSTNIVLNDINGSRDPVQMVKEPLLTNLNQDKEMLASDTGNLSTEQVRRIQDQYDASGTGFIQRLIDSVRVNRINAAVATRQAVDVLRDAVTNYFPGIRNAILDVSDPLLEPKSNTFWHEVTFGNYDGNLFSNEKTAKNFADLNGLQDTQFVQGEGPITNKRVQQLLDRKTALEKKLNENDIGLRTNKARAADESLDEAARAKAQEQVEGFTQLRPGFQKELDEVNLRLKSEATYDRVSDLSSRVAQLRSVNKDLAKAIKDPEQYPKGSDKRAHAIASLKFGRDQIAEHLQEIKALSTDQASVIGRKDTIQQHGVGYKIVARRPLVETDRAVRDLMIRDHNGNLIPEAVSTSSQTGFKALFNAALWRFRGADDTLAINESIQRKIATYTQSLFKEWAAQEASHIRQIASGVIRQDPVTGDPIPYWKAKPQAIWDKLTGKTKKQYGEFTRTLEFARDARDPDGNIGYFFRTPGELNTHYLTYFNREPTFAEHQAYFAFTRMVEGDRILREISEFRNRARQGVEQFRLTTRGPRGVKVQSDFFDGRKLMKFPGGDDVLMVMGTRQGDEQLYNLGGAGLHPNLLEKYRHDVETGRKIVIEVYAPEHTPLREFSEKAGNEHVRYILADNAESKPIEFNHVNRRGGGHFEYDYDHFLKQANMYHQWENVAGVKGRYRSVYTGDTTFMPLLNRAMGHDIASKLHEVQRLIREGQLDEAKNFTESNLPIEWNKLHGMFKPGRDSNGRVTPPLLDLREPFVVVPKGRTVLDMDKTLEARYGSSFKDASKSGSLNRQFSVAYNTERESEGIQHFMDVGTPGNPVYQYSPTTRFIDPITTMNKALNRIVGSVFMDDYKMYAVEHWLREAEEHLEPVRAKLARSSPYWAFTSSNDKSAFRAGTSWETVRNLLSNRYKIQQFLGIPSQFDAALHSAKQMLVDWSYNKFGPEEGRSAVAKAVTLIPDWMISHVHDPVTVMRSLTFHAKLGLFNPAQWLVQAQTFANILAISPKHGVSGTFATMLYNWSRMNGTKEITDALDGLATKLHVPGFSGFRPGEFREATEALDRTGFANVAGEYANLNTALKTDFVGNDAKSLLHAGTFFFREGEKATRVGAWYTAFREFREANPTEALNNTNLGKILQRADLLTANMSRASNSVMQSGVFSLTTQFLTYTTRLAELMLGNRLTRLEKARMVLFYSALYGAPSAVGLYGLPFADNIRQEAIQRGYNIGENWINTAVMEGLPAIGLAMITGEGNLNRGNVYNVGARYGAQGLTQLESAMRSDLGWYQLMAGASGTTLLNALTSTSPFLHAVGHMIAGDKENPFPMKFEDILEPFKEITTVNQTWKLLAAINTGQWMTKNEGTLGPVTAANATFMALTGLSPQAQDDMYIKADIMKQQEAMQKWVMTKAVQSLRRGFRDQADQNHTSAADHFRRADAWMTMSGFPIERRASVYAQAARASQGMIKDQDWTFATRNVPQSRSDLFGIPTPFTTQSNLPQTRLNQFRSQLQLNNLRNQ